MHVVHGHVLATHDAMSDEGLLPALRWCEEVFLGRRPAVPSLRRIAGPADEARYWIGSPLGHVPVGTSHVAIEWPSAVVGPAHGGSLEATLSLLPGHVRAAFLRTGPCVWLLPVYA